MSTEGIVIDGLLKRFEGQEKPALNQIRALIHPGRITGVVGPDGAGKTTLLRTMAGLLKPTEGGVTVGGLNALLDAPLIHQNLGYMPQKFGLYEDLTVLENLTLYAKLKDVRRRDMQAVFEKLLTFTKLGPFQDRLAGKLSGGMKQKLGLACTLLKEPKVLLLDEPSVGVDPISRRDLWALVKEFLGGGTTVVWSTAYLDEAALCDDVLVLNEGDLLFTGTPGALTKRLEGRVFQAVHPSQDKRSLLLHFLKNENVVDGLIQGDGVRLVLKKGATTDLLTTDAPMTWESVTPTFEDGFIDLLGGITERESELAALVDTMERHEGEVIKVEHIVKEFGDFKAVGGISFGIKQGEIFGFLGPNGAGKSTTFKMLCGLLTPTQGKALVLGNNLRQADQLAKRRIGYMAQKFSLYGNLTVSHNLSFFSGIYGLSGKEQTREIDSMIETFNLRQYLNEPADSLPLGYKQRLALACSVMHRPSILFLDEPTSGVDPLTRREFWMHINGMVQKGVTVMVTTHFIEEAEYCDRACLIYRGLMIALGTPDDLKQKAKQEGAPLPSLEETFIALIQDHDSKNPLVH